MYRPSMSNLPDVPAHLTSTLNVTNAKPLPEPDSTRPSSDLSSIGPSQSASQVNLLPPPIPLNYNRFLDSGPSQQYHTPPTSAHLTSQPDISQPQINIPPAHAISDDNSMPLATYTHDVNAGGYGQRRVLERRITEEDMHSRSQDDLNGPTGETSASENENEGLATGKLSVIENPRFASVNGSADGSGGTPEKKKFSLRPEANGDALNSSPLKDSEKDKDRHGKSFFGSIRGLFGSRSKDKEHDRPLEREGSIDSRDAHPRSPLGGLFPKRNQSQTAVGHSPSKKWDTRTERNIRSLQKAGSDEEPEANSNPRPPVNFSPVVMRDIIAESGPGRYRGRVGRKRVASDVGVTAMASVPSHENGSNVGGTGRRLKKARASSVQVETRVRASPTSMGSPSASAPTQPEPKERIVRPGDSGGESEKEKAKANVKRNGSSVRRAEEWVGGQHKQRAIESAKGDNATSAEPPRKPKGVARSSTLAAIPVPSVASTPVKGNASAAKSTQGNKGSASDSEASPIGRKKSLKKIYPVAPVPAIVIPAGGDSPSGTLSASANLSRNSSIISATSAPPLNALGQGMTVASVARRASAGVNHKPVTDTKSTERKGSLSIHPAAPHASLMSIVEDVARGNRDAWSQNQEEKVRILRNSGAQKRAGVVDLGVVKAPPRMGRQDILNLEMAKSNPPPRKLIDVPIAPGSVVDMLRAREPEGDGAQRNSIDGLPNSASASEIMKGEGTSKVSSRPTKSPLRSAMKNPSRTPSPLLQQSSHQRSVSSGAPFSKPTPELYNIVAPSPITPRTMPGLLGSPLSQQVTLAPVLQVPAPDTSHSNPQLPPAPSNSPPKENEANQEENDHDDADSSSISSYETGQEGFSDDEDTEREVPPNVESVNVEPPRAETHVAIAEAHRSTAQHVNKHSNGYFPPQRLNQSSNTASPKQPDVQRTQGQGSNLPRIAVRASGSDVSSSAGSNVVNPNQTPRRRKSVRVSLKPTFSPTPPAIDDDDDGDVRQARAPWVWKQEAALPSSSTPPRSLPPPKQNGNADVVDMWADSSEEDEEYQKAKRMLIRAARKEKKAKS